MTNKLRLILNNFQSISNGELEFESGLNFILGQSNSGKTATFRALKTCLMNTLGSQRYIKKGTSEADVTLHYLDNVITWQRTPKESRYIINGQPNEKTGKSNALKILENQTGFVDNEDTLMNIEEELQLPFPFGYSKSELFKLYENVFCVSDSSVILKGAKEQEDVVKNEIASLDNELNKNKIKLKELQTFKKDIDLKVLKNYLRELKAQQQRLLSLRDGMEIIQKAVKANNVNLSISEIDLTDKVKTYKDLVATFSRIKRLKKLHSLSKTLRKEDYTNYLDKYFILVQLKREFKKLQDLNKIKFSKKEFKDLIAEYNSLVQYYNSLKEIERSIKDKEEKKKYYEDVMIKSTEELKKFKVCPLCHSKLN